MANKTYHEQNEINNVILLRNILSDMPKYVTTFFRSIEYSKAPRTRLGYARDLKSFYEYLCDTNPSLKGKRPIDENDRVSKLLGK